MYETAQHRNVLLSYQEEDAHIRTILEEPLERLEPK